MKEIELAVQRAVMKKMDIEAIASRLAPKLEKAMEIGFIKAFQDLESNDDFIQELSDALPTGAIARMIGDIVKKTLTNDPRK